MPWCHVCVYQKAKGIMEASRKAKFCVGSSEISLFHEVVVYSG